MTGGTVQVRFEPWSLTRAKLHHLFSLFEPRAPSSSFVLQLVNTMSVFDFSRPSIARDVSFCLALSSPTNVIHVSPHAKEG